MLVSGKFLAACSPRKLLSSSVNYVYAIKVDLKHCSNIGIPVSPIRICEEPISRRRGLFKDGSSPLGAEELGHQERGEHPRQSSLPRAVQVRVRESGHHDRIRTEGKGRSVVPTLREYRIAFGARSEGASGVQELAVHRSDETLPGILEQQTRQHTLRRLLRGYLKPSVTASRQFCAMVLF